MKIGTFAHAARTTTRTVRHYHQLGLLPEPQRRANGYREYELTDLVRLLRISWLARAGVPLSKIGDLLERADGEQPGGPSTEASDAADQPNAATTARELELVAITIQSERDRLDRQLTALGQIRAAVEQGRALSALPSRLAAALDAVAGSASAPTRTIIERDRELLEVMALSGELREEMVDAYAELAADPAQLSETLRIGAAFAALEGNRIADVDGQINDLVEAMLAAPAVQEMLVGADEVDPPTAEDAAFFLPDPAQREVMLRMLRRLS